MRSTRLPTTVTILFLQVTVSTTVDSSHGEEATLNEVPLTQHHGKHEIATRYTTRPTPYVTGHRVITDNTKHEKKATSTRCRHTTYRDTRVALTLLCYRSSYWCKRPRRGNSALNHPIPTPTLVPPYTTLHHPIRQRLLLLMMVMRWVRKTLLILPLG